MSGSTKISIPNADIDSTKVYNKGKSDEYVSDGRKEAVSASSDVLDTINESPIFRQDTFYVDSTIQNSSFEHISELENLDTIENEEFETEELTDEVVEYRPRTLLESVDAMLLILDDLGDRYNKWKYGNNGIYRFYCHKYNLTKIDASRPYYTKILSQLNTMNNMSLHLLSSHYQKMSDSAVYSSNEVVDTVLCQLDEFVSCYCCKNCAFAISKKGAHVCSDLKVNHTCLKWKNPSSSERFLTVSRPQPNRTHLIEKSKSTDKISLSEKTKYLNKTKSMDRNTVNHTQSSDTIQDSDSPDKQKTEEVPVKMETEQKGAVKNMNCSCFIREMGYYDQCVMEYFSERGIMHNFSHPYRKGEETTFIHSFLRAVVCHNCGKFCRCRCQRKIFRTVKSSSDGSIDLAQFSGSPSGLSSGSDSQEMSNKVDSLEKTSMQYVNGVYEQFHKEDPSSDSLETTSDARRVSGIAPLDANTLYSHTLNSGFGKVQFLMNLDSSLSQNKKTGVNKNNALEISSCGDTSTYDDSIAINALKGSKIDSNMGSVYYSNLFKGTSCKVTVEEIFTIVNNVPFTSVSEELLNHYKKVEWHELYRSPWWCLDDKFDDPKYFEDQGNLEAYAVKVLDALGYLGNLRYDAAFKVIGVGYYRKKSCYWRYFYVNRNLWECFRDSVEYFIMISTLPSDVYIDTKLSSWIGTYKGVQKKFPLSPSLLKSYRQLLAFLKLLTETSKDYKHVSGVSKSKESKGPFHNNTLKFNHLLKEDYGTDVFDVTKVGEHECTVADVIGVALKRKLVSSGDSCTPRRQYIQKATTVTPTVKVKLDPEMIYQGLFATNATNTNTAPNTHTSRTNVKNQATNASNNSLSGSVASDFSRSDFNLSNFNKIKDENSVGNYNTNKENNGNNMGSDGTCYSREMMQSINSATASNVSISNKVGSGLVNGTQKSSLNYTNNNSNTIGNRENTNKENNNNNADVSIDLKLNNLNAILSYYPDVCSQYSAITRQANDLRVQVLSLMSDLKKVSADQINQNSQETNLFKSNANNVDSGLVNGTEVTTKKLKNIKNISYNTNDNKENTNKENNSNNKENNNRNEKNKQTNQIKINQKDDTNQLVNGKLGDKMLEKMKIEHKGSVKNSVSNEIYDFSTDDEDEVKELPMFGVCYNSRNNSWSCLLEVVPCLVCPLECERNGTCLHYTQGKKLIETICTLMKPCDVKYTVHPHFRTDINQAHKGARPEISIISFSVNQYGHERARLLASQLKAIYKIQALNSMLINMSCNSNDNTNSNSIDNNENTNKENNKENSNKDKSNNTSGANTPKEKSSKLAKEKEQKQDKEENKKKNKKEPEVKNEKKEKDRSVNEQFDKTVEMELLHNAITAQLTTMISTHSYIAQSSYHDLDDDNGLWSSGNGTKGEGMDMELGLDNRKIRNIRNLINARRARILKRKNSANSGKIYNFLKTKKETNTNENKNNKENNNTNKENENKDKENKEKEMNGDSKSTIDSWNLENSDNTLNSRDFNTALDNGSGVKDRSDLDFIDLNGVGLLKEENMKGSQVVQLGLEMNNSDNKENNNKRNENNKNDNTDEENENDDDSVSGSASSFDLEIEVDTTSTTDNFDGSNNESESAFLMCDDKVNETEQTKDALNDVNPRRRNRPKHYKKKHSLRNQLDNGTCICYYYGKKLVGNQGQVRVSEVLSFNDNLYTFSNMLEVKSMLQFNSNKLHYCPLHCCFVTVWKDAMEQTRIMYHQAERFIDFKTFNNMVIRFKNDWPNAIKLHNNYAHSIDATEGARMFAQTNRALTDCFLILLNLQKAINDALVASLALATRALTDASQEKSLINRLFLINKNMEVSGETVRNSLLFANEILFPFGALHDEATPPLSDNES